MRILNIVLVVQDVFDLPFHMARDQIEHSLRAKMSTIKVRAIAKFIVLEKVRSRKSVEQMC